MRFLSRIARLFSNGKVPIKTYPYLARLVQHPLRCRACKMPLIHDDAVVCFQPDLSSSSDISHARCVAFVQREDGTIEIQAGDL